MKFIGCDKCGMLAKIADDTTKLFCACGHITVIKESKIIQQTEPIEFVFDGSALWKELHEYAVLNKNNWDPINTKQWFEEWTLKVPSLGCPCKTKWRKLTLEFPPNFNSPEEFFKWAFDAHNKVNETLNKPIFLYEDALKIYKF